MRKVQCHHVGSEAQKSLVRFPNPLQRSGLRDQCCVIIGRPRCYGCLVRMGLSTVQQRRVIRDENLWRNKSSKLNIFGPLFSKTHSAMRTPQRTASTQLRTARQLILTEKTHVVPHFICIRLCHFNKIDSLTHSLTMRFRKKRAKNVQL